MGGTQSSGEQVSSWQEVSLEVTEQRKVSCPAGLAWASQGRADAARVDTVPGVRTVSDSTGVPRRLPNTILCAQALCQL